MESAQRVQTDGPPGPAQLPPGPRAPTIVQTIRFLRDEVGLLEDCRARYGDAFTLRIANLGDFVVLGDPEIVRQALILGAESAHAGEARTVLEPLVGANSMLLLDDEPHVRQRRLMSAPFKGERLNVYGEVIRELTNREVDSWPLHAPFPIRPSMQTITLRVVMRAIFGLEDDARQREVEDALRPMMDLGMLLVSLPALQLNLGPLSPRRRFDRRKARVDALLLDEIARRRRARDLDEREDVLSILVRAQVEDGDMRDEELRDQLLTLLIAGHDTTATALAWAFERVLRHPHVHSRLVEEVRAGETEYVDAVVKEVLRVRPVLSFGMRNLQAPIRVDGCTLPAGTLVGGSFHLAHHHPGAFHEPERFKPERFIDRKTETISWLPFGLGVRRCVGAAFALFEMRVVLQTILGRAEFAPAREPPEPRRRRAVSLAPAADARVTMTVRRPAPVREVAHA
ncbi:MAG TPA: cytochrome P450 [Solirubrobacteraceae bacterium]|nr:cytochrome P450 [Solirubrobacteraceae bacterium]